MIEDTWCFGVNLFNIRKGRTVAMDERINEDDITIQLPDDEETQLLDPDFVLEDEIMYIHSSNIIKYE